MTQSELRIYINTAAAEAMKDLRRMRNEIAALEASAKSMRAAARGSGAGTFFSAADIASAEKMNAAINGVAASNRRAASSTSATSSATNRAATSAQNLARANDLASIALQKLSAAEAIANTKMQEGTASATQMSAAYGRVAAAAGAASAAQVKLAAAQAAVGSTGRAAAATTMATELLRTQKGFVGLQREMGVAAARGDEFGHRTKTSLFDTLASINDNESAMRRWGSQIQWTGRQMMSNLTVPIALVAGLGGKVWFDQAQAMVGVEKVYGDISNAAGANERELDALGKKFTELSNIFGINREEVIGVATDWAAAGASGIELARATNLTMQAMVLGNLSAEESTKALIATQAQYGFSVKEMSNVLAQFNFVENETGVTMGGLIQAFSRTAGVAREAGMDTAHLASMIAAMTPAAGSASEAGNGLKTIMTRLMRQTKDTTGTLELMNINVKEFASLPMDQKLMEVAKGFENLDDAQKGAAAGILAGGWQVNRMSVAMRELTNETGYYHKALRGLNDDNKVQQVMVRELTKQLTSDPKKLQQAWQRLRNAMAEIFVPIVPYVLYFMNSIAELAQKFNELPVPIQKLAVAIAMFLAALGPIIIMLGVFALVASSIKTPFIIIGTVLGFLVKGPFVALGKALTSGTGILGTFGAAAMRMGAILKAVFLGRLVTAVGAASAFVTGRVAAMAAAVSARFAAMTAAVAAHAGAHMTLTVGQWVKVLAADAVGWAMRLGTQVGGQAASTLSYAAFWVKYHAITWTHMAIEHASYAAFWVKYHAILLAGWLRTHVLTAVNAAKNVAIFLLSFNAVAAGLLVHWAKLTIINAAGWLRMQISSAAGWAVVHAINAAGWAVDLAMTIAGSLRRAAMMILSFNLVSARLLAHWAKLKMIELGGWIASNAITAAGLLAKMFAWTKSLDLITIKQLIFWAKTNLMTKGGMMAMLRTVGSMLLRVAAVFIGPWGLAIAAVLGLIYIFRDKIKAAIQGIVHYFQNLPPEMAAKLQPLVNLWQKIVGGAQAAFNALPGFIQRPLVAVVKFVKAAAMKIYELFSYINPFAKHSPSLVDNVNNGMDAVANRFGLAAKQVGGSVSQMYKQIKALKDAAGGLDSINANAKREEDIGKIQQGGGPNSGAQVAAYNAVSSTLADLKGNLGPVNAAMDAQQRKVDSLSAAMKAADAAIDGMGEGLDKLKERAEAVGAQLDAAKERVEYFKGATISGMGAAEDAAFSNEMAQKKLQLQMKKLGDAATDGTDKARDEYAKLQGDIETLSGKRMELQFAGAGSDVLGGYDSMINGLKGQQLDIGSGASATGPAAEVDALQRQLDELQRQAEIMDLEKALKFDPLTRQIEKATSTAYEIPFDSIMSGLSSSGAQVDSLTRAYDRANAAVDSQQSAIDAAQAARDQLGKTYDAESEALESLKTVYGGIETAIRDGEQALNDMVSSADTAIQRIEEMERKREEATRKANEATGGSGSGGGADSLSPNMQSLMNAAGAEPFPEVGGGLAIGRDESYGLDQSQAIEDFDLLSENGLEGMFGDISMLGPFKKAWQGVKDWWSGIVLPLGDPVKSVGDEVGNIIQGAFGAEATGPLATFMDVLGKVGGFFVNLWNIVKGFGELLWGSIFPAIKEMGENIMANLGPALERVGGVFVENWPKIQSFAKMLWEVIKVVGIIAGVIAGALVGAIILSISVFVNIFANVIGPLIDFIGRLIEAIVNVVMGIVGVITGLYNIIVGLFTGDWSRVWEGIKQLGTGIWSIIKGIWDAIVAVFKGAWDLVWGIVKGFVEGIIDFFTTLWDVLVGHSIVPDTINAIIDWFKSLPGKVFDFVSNLVRGVIDFFLGLHAKAIELVVNLIDGIVGWFSELPGKVWNTLVDLKNKILGFFSGAKDWLKDAGKNIIEGLLDGAGSLLSKLGNFFADKIPAGIIRDGFKKALGIESPAREMMGPGADVVRGIMAGAESQMPALDSLMSNVAGVVAATELVAPTIQAAGVALPAAVDGAAPVPLDAAPAPVGITPEQSAEALAAFTAFDMQYDLLIAAHTAGVVANYSAMYASIATQQGASHAAQLAAQTAFAASFVASVTAMVAAVIAQFTSMGAQNTALLTSSTASWLTLIITFINNFLTQWTAFINNLLSVTTSGVAGITGLWQTLAQNLGSVLNDSIRPVFESFLPMLETLEGWFATTVQNIGTIWGEIEPKTKAPARVVINDVYNTGLRTAWNNFNEFLGLKPLPEYTAKFRGGGRVDFHDGGSVHGPGTGLSDSIPARLSRGEHVITAREVQAAGGHRAIEAQRAAWKAGQVYADGPNRELVAAFRNGGAVGEKGYKYGGAIVGAGFRGGTPQMDSIANLIGKYFPGMTLISGWRFTDTLNHSKGLAVDASNAGDEGSPQMQEMARFFYKNYKPMLNELIHYPTNGFRGVSMGQDYNFGSGTNAAHRNHVHISANRPLPAPGTPIIPIMSGGGGGGAGISMDWGAYIGEAFDQAFAAVKDPKIAGGIGQWIPKSIEKSMTAKDFLVKKSEEMNSYMGTIDDSMGAAERWRPMMKAALLRQGLPEWANDKAILDRFIKQIWTESKGNPNIAQQIVDMNGTGEAAGVGLGQAIPGTWAAFRDPSLPDNRRDPWAMTNFMARYVRQKYGPQGYMSIGNGIGYDNGGVLPPTPGGFGTYFNHTGGPEAVLTDPQWDAVYRAAMATTEAEEVARGFRNAVLSGEYQRATDTAAKQVTREFGPKVDELALEYFDSAKLIADVAAEQGETWRDQFATTMEGVQKFFGTVSELYTIGKDIYTKLEEDGVIKEIEEATKAEVAALQDIANKVQSGAEVNEAMLRQVGANLSSMANSTIAILAKQPFETYAPIFDKLAGLADMLPKAQRSYVPWAGLETDMTVGKSIELGLNTVGNGVKGLYNIAQSVAGPILRNVSGIGGVISRFATENTGAVSAIMAAVTTGNPLLALPFLPQIIDALFELIPMVIQAIIDIVPNLIQAIIDFFDFLNPFNVPSYDSLEEAVKASNEATADVRSGKYQYERGANSDWRPTDDGTKEMNFYGDLSFPNIENGEDAEEFVGNLKRMG